MSIGVIRLCKLTLRTQSSGLQKHVMVDDLVESASMSLYAIEHAISSARRKMPMGWGSLKGAFQESSEWRHEAHTEGNEDCGGGSGEDNEGSGTALAFYNPSPRKELYQL